MPLSGSVFAAPPGVQGSVPTRYLIAALARLQKQGDLNFIFDTVFPPIVAAVVGDRVVAGTVDRQCFGFEPIGLETITRIRRRPFLGEPTKTVVAC